MTAALALAAPRTLPCEANPDLWFQPPGRDTGNWWREAAAVCGHCPVRRTCIETELLTGRPDGGRIGMVLGGWVWVRRRPRPHWADHDLYAAHYPKETR
jgi:hypothetical protein